MTSFIVCEDNNVILQKNIDIINRVMFENNIEYRVYSFSSYSDELKKVIKTNIGKKIYVLDIELEDASGLDIASDIRDIDLSSLIILSTSYTDFLPYTLKSKLMLFGFVSKFQDYETNLSSILSRAIKSSSNNMTEEAIQEEELI